MKKPFIILSVVAAIAMLLSLASTAVWAIVIIALPTPTYPAVIEATMHAPGPSPTLAHALHTIPPARPQATASPTNSPTSRPPMVAPRLPASTNTPQAYPVATETQTQLPPPPPVGTIAPTQTESLEMGLPPVPATEAP